MEQNFQTSFIPKRSIVKERAVLASSVSFFTVLTMIAFFAIAAGTGFLYFYKGVLSKNISKMENELNLAQNPSELSKIAELQTLNNRLVASSEILSKHVAVTPIFEALAEVTLKTVRFTSFNYTVPVDIKGEVSVKLTGVAIGYRSVALQADLFAQNKNIRDPVFSNLQLDDKGNVVFDLNFSVDPNFVNYKQTVLTREASN